MVATTGLAVTAAVGVIASTTVFASAQTDTPAVPNRSAQTTTPIKHVVVIFDENISFDHYFGTYPLATNTDGTKFVPSKQTPSVDNLVTSGNLASNPNLYKPKRLSSAQALTCDQNHGYTPEQQATDNGKMDMFVQKVSVDSCTGEYGNPGLTMDYYDGNTVTGIWNYAQQYAMSDNSFGTGFGPSTPGALNLVAGQTHGFQAVTSITHQPTTDSYAVVSPDSNGVGTVINDPDPAYDDCSDSNHTSTNNLAAATTTNKNIGDLLNARGVTWGWFQGGFAPTANVNGMAVCGATHTNIGGASVADYSPHHNPFEYYASTSNPHHLPPSSLAKIGRTDRANHEYDLSYFQKSLKAGSLPAVSFLKAGEYQDGHAGYSDPIDEQHFLVNEINAIQKSKYWSNTAVVIAYDDSDGWYDHVFSPITNSSHDSAKDDVVCTTSTAATAGGYQDRCGPGPRLPLLVISPYARTDFIDHNKSDQASITQFIENNWSTGQIGDSSFDATAGSLNTLFNFAKSNNKRVILKPNGAVQSITPIRGKKV